MEFSPVSLTDGTDCATISQMTDREALDDWLRRSAEVLSEHELVVKSNYKFVESFSEDETDFSEKTDLRTYGLLDLQDFYESQI